MRRENCLDNLLLRVWPEVCRHIEIHIATANVAKLLAARMQLRAVIVRRINLPGACLDTVAIGAPQCEGPVNLERTPCSAEQLKSILTWCARGEVLPCGRARRPAELRGMIPSDTRGDVLIGPLTAPDGPSGILILVAPEEQGFLNNSASLLGALLEPFSAALENDRRLHETAQLREAAEADRRALLTKLGRSDVNAPIVGAEAGLRPVMERVATVAASDVPVLLFGETGTGKEMIARAIHTHSPRAAGPFLRVNCGAIPPELIDSQLFGHEKGSFTGATDMRKGWFERADGGTLFLDEVGDLPLAVQVRLLRILQDGALERVGGQHPLHVDVRVVGATHRDLAAMVRADTFREDLWYRLAVFPISIPPLRDRLDDISSLARHFAEKAATRFGLALVMPTADDIRMLMGYDWPGNVRELATVIDRAALLGNGRKLEVASALGAVPAPNGTPRAAERRAMTSAAPVSTTDVSEQEAHAFRQRSLDEVMRAHIEAALHAAHGRVEGPFGAAAQLRINPQTLRSRMRKLGVDWRAFRR